MQAIGGTHLLVVQGMKAHIFQGDMAICPECQETAVSYRALFKGNGYGHWGIQVDPIKNQPSCGENNEILHFLHRFVFLQPMEWNCYYSRCAVPASNGLWPVKEH